MSRWIVGDIHGCYDELMALIAKMHIDTQQDKIYLLGDLINRGPKSLEVIEYVMENDHVETILGNHDIHLIAQYFHREVKKPSKELQQLLDVPQAETIIQWLRHRPFVIQLDNNILVHAGIHPNWTIEQTLNYNQELSDFFYKQSIHQSHT